VVSQAESINADLKTELLKFCANLWNLWTNSRPFPTVAPFDFWFPGQMHA